jgi:hypothetical protein
LGNREYAPRHSPGDAASYRGLQESIREVVAERRKRHGEGDIEGLEGMEKDAPFVLIGHKPKLCRIDVNM